jgi:hypothetical protein
MPSQQAATSADRLASFDTFHAELAPVLIEFIDALGIEPAQEVLKQAGHYLPYVEQALCDMAIADAEDRTWLLVRMTYYIGEVFAQQYGGHWYVNEMPGARSAGRYVVGRFSAFANDTLMVDPFELASAYVDLPCPRPLAALVAAVESGLAGATGAGLH